MKSIILKGGLGNQLFQLAKFLDLKKNKIQDLRLDINTGFLLDRKYKRKLELEVLINKEYKASKFQILINITIVILNKFNLLPAKILGVNIVDDYKSLELDKLNKIILYNGYFQNNKIVQSNLMDIFALVKPNFFRAKSPQFKELISLIESCEHSIALCIRFYEESKDPKKHARINSNLKKVEDFNRIIKKCEQSLGETTFFLFVQSENEFTDKLIFNSKVYVISHKNGYTGSWERLTAQAYCSHHIFNNSTFYYWGAVFSRFFNINGDVKPQIYVSDNFIFNQIYDPKWEKF